MLEIKCRNQNICVTLIWAIVGNAKGFILRVIHWVYYFWNTCECNITRRMFYCQRPEQLKNTFKMFFAIQTTEGYNLILFWCTKYLLYINDIKNFLWCNANCVCNNLRQNFLDRNSIMARIQCPEQDIY